MSVNKDQWGNVNTYNFSKVCDFARIDRRFAELISDELSADGTFCTVTIVDKTWGDTGFVRKFQVDRDSCKVVEVPLTVNVIEDTRTDEEVMRDGAARTAAELPAADAEELLVKMRKNEINGIGLLVLHNYVKDQLTRIVRQRGIDFNELRRWTAVDDEVEAMMRQVFPS